MAMVKRLPIGDVSVCVKAEIFIVDDQKFVREALVELVRRERDMIVCGEAGDMAPALEGIQKTNPKVVLVDMELASSSGIALIRCLRQLYPTMAVLGMTALDPKRYKRKAMAAGATGFVTKSEGGPQIIAAIRNFICAFVAARVCIASA
jgi:DNA-binding NarL/FixJ family response regulator